MVKGSETPSYVLTDVSEKLLAFIFGAVLFLG